MSDLFKPNVRPEAPQYPTRASLRGRTPPSAGTTDTAPMARVAPGTAPPADSAATSPPGPPDDSPVQPSARSLPKAVAVVVALAGAVVIAFGVLQGTVFRPPTTITASLAAAPAQPIVVSRVGLMGLNGPRSQVTASSATGKPVFLGLGRAGDVEAYLARVKRLSLTGEDGQGALTARSEGTEASLPDPGAADVWVVSQRGRGSASLNWPNVAGQWVVVSATDGQSAAPSKLTFTWSGATTHSTSAAFIAVGAVFLICGLVLLVMLISRSRLENEA